YRFPTASWVDNWKSNSPRGFVFNPFTPYLYVENANLNAGYFCNDCIYFIKDKQCAIVKSEGPDVNGRKD
ncbi:MAG TPA: hypothetical protein VF884_11795, partial [Nitrososphaeraceae archaeon]